MAAIIFVCLCTANSGLIGVNKPIVQEEQRMRPALSEVLKLVSDNALAFEKMGWSPQVTLDDGLRQTIEFVKANRNLFRTDGYVR
jgi:nucleoside-diphosphate-sugar epimerase